jgi:hypothetical protein
VLTKITQSLFFEESISNPPKKRGKKLAIIKQKGGIFFRRLTNPAQESKWFD